MPQGRPPNIQNVIRRQESLALNLLAEALDRNVSVDIKLDIFDRVSRYLAVKNRINDNEETDIDRFKARIHGTQTETPQGRGRGRAEAVTSPDKLTGIKDKLSGRGDRSLNGDHSDPGVEVPPAS